MSLSQINNVITGVWAIFLRKKNALNYFTVNLNIFIASFATIFLVLIFQLYMAPLEIQIFDKASGTVKLDDVDTSFQTFVLIVNWFLWPAITFVICRLMGLSQNYIRYVIVDNFSSIVTLTIIAIPSILFQFGLPADVAKSFIFFSSFIMLIYKWRVIRVSLDTTGMNSSILLFIDIAVTILVSSALRSVWGG